MAEEQEGGAREEPRTGCGDRDGTRARRCRTGPFTGMPVRMERREERGGQSASGPEKGARQQLGRQLVAVTRRRSMCLRETRYPAMRALCVVIVHGVKSHDPHNGRPGTCARMPG
ncbi:hypothetical protein GCM10020229_56900 [Kitasatospora albolonga]